MGWVEAKTSGMISGGGVSGARAESEALSVTDLRVSGGCDDLHDPAIGSCSSKSKISLGMIVCSGDFPIPTTLFAGFLTSLGVSPSPSVSSSLINLSSSSQSGSSSMSMSGGGDPAQPGPLDLASASAAIISSSSSSSCSIASCVVVRFSEWRGLVEEPEPEAETEG
jgi:hypothetical protein